MAACTDLCLVMQHQSRRMPSPRKHPRRQPRKPRQQSPRKPPKKKHRNLPPRYVPPSECHAPLQCSVQHCPGKQPKLQPDSWLLRQGALTSYRNNQHGARSLHLRPGIAEARYHCLLLLSCGAVRTQACITPSHSLSSPSCSTHPSAAVLHRQQHQQQMWTMSRGHSPSPRTR